ncbi:MAG: ABC transporter permease subunit [Planctomycetota bacterium]
MKWLSSRYTLPLLTKDLIEQSARRKLFVIRVVYVLLLIVMASVFVLPVIQNRSFTPLGLLGVGKQIFLILVFLQFAGVYLFLPGLCSGMITVEKERNTLGLLFLTKLGPWTIIFEKLGSRLVLMFTLLITSLPLIAFTYSLGGIAPFDLFCGVWYLGLSVLLISSLATFASAYFRTTAAAFVATCLMLLALSFGPVFLDQALFGGNVQKGYAGIGRMTLVWLLGDETHRVGDFALLMWFPPGQFGVLTASQIGPSSVAYLIVFLTSVPSLLTAGGALWVGQMCLVPRAFLPPSNHILNLFKFLDSGFYYFNQRYARGVMVMKEVQSLPDMQPVTWRETTKRSLGQLRYLVRILLVLEIPVLFFSLDLLSTGGYSQGLVRISFVVGALWIVITLVLLLQGATLIAGERARQTLDVLLTTPLSSRQIILQKMSGITRLIIVCAIPLVTCLVLETWARHEQQILSPSRVTAQALHDSLGLRPQPFIWHEYLLSGLATIVIYLNVFSWLSLWLGIRSKSPSRSILISVGTLVAWSVVPIVFMIFLFAFVLDPVFDVEFSTSSIKLGLLASPVSCVLFSESEGLAALHPIPYVGAIVNALLYGTCWWWLRWDVLLRADRYLGRGSRNAPHETPVMTMVPHGAAITA